MALLPFFFNIFHVSMKYISSKKVFLATSFWFSRFRLPFAEISKNLLVEISFGEGWLCKRQSSCELEMGVLTSKFRWPNHWEH